MSREKKGYTVHSIEVLQDNIIWVLVKGKEAIVIDPAVMEPVKAWLEAKQLELIAVLQTHHHEDHIGGTKALVKHWPKAIVVASEADLERIPFQSLSVVDGQKLSLLEQFIYVIEVCGHTRNH